MGLRLICLAVLAMFQACSIKPGSFSSTSVPPQPDYGNPEHWAALPEKKDFADEVPDSSFTDLQATAAADVFFLHPTTYFDEKGPWNAPLEDVELNRQTDESAILHQASIFNAAGRVYAPRYRQARYQSFFSGDERSAQAAWDLAYEDIRAAFFYYLNHYNNGRPIVLAAHSQGAKHGIRLLKEVFDGQPLSRQLAAAYLVGWAIKKDEFDDIKPCEMPTDTGCFCAWRSFRYGHLPDNLPVGDHIAVINPITWEGGPAPVGKDLNKGTVLRNYYKIFPGIADAVVHEGLIWVHKPKFPGSIFFTRKNYHIADFNLFWANVRENAQLRVAEFLDTKESD